MSPRFSVIVACTRPHLVGSAIRTVLNQEFQDFELLVSDNSDGSAADEIAAASGGRARYLRPPERLPVVPHWNFAFEQARGDWQLLVCDDDGIAPNLLGLLARLADTHPDVDSMAWLSASYTEGYHHTDGRGRLNIPGYRPGIRVLESKALLERMFASGTGNWGVVKRDVPLISHGVFSRRVIEKVRKGFGGPLFLPFCPMTSAAAGVLALSKQTLRIDLPLRVLGNTKDSAGAHRSDGSQLRRMHEGSEFNHVPLRMVTNFPSATAESLMKARAALPDLLGGYSIDWAKYLFACNSAVEEKGVGSEERAAFKAACDSLPADVVRRFEALVAEAAKRSWWRRLKQRAVNACLPADRVITVDSIGVKNIADCARYLGDLTRNSGKQLA